MATQQPMNDFKTDDCWRTNGLGLTDGLMIATAVAGLYVISAVVLGVLPQAIGTYFAVFCIGFPALMYAVDSEARTTLLRNWRPALWLASALLGAAAAGTALLSVVTTSIYGPWLLPGLVLLALLASREGLAAALKTEHALFVLLSTSALMLGAIGLMAMLLRA
jgi:hypothetical protein